MISKTFAAVPATDDPAIAETFAEYGIPHYSVVPVGIDAYRVIFPEGELHYKMEDAFTAAIARYAVYGGIRA